MRKHLDKFRGDKDAKVHAHRPPAAHCPPPSPAAAPARSPLVLRRHSPTVPPYAQFRLILIESRIHRVARYYKSVKALPPNFKYESATASTLVS